MCRYLLVLFFILSIRIVFCQNPIEVIPIDLVRNLIFVDVHLNDYAKPLHFMFDTGAGITVIHSEVSERIDLNISDTIFIGTAGKSVKSGLSSFNRIRLGKNLILGDLDIAIMNLSHLNRYLKTNVDGIIGNELLQNLVTEANMELGELRFYSFNDFEYQGQGKTYRISGMESGYIGIPFDIVFEKGKESMG